MSASSGGAARALVIALALATAHGCGDVSLLSSCSVKCSQLSACPDGMLCAVDGFCHETGDRETCRECVPATCSEGDVECGIAPDGCGGEVHCGGCAESDMCGAGGPNRCGTGDCSPRNCEQQRAGCGIVSDGCAGVIYCGTCGDDQQCAVEAGGNRCVGPGPVGGGPDACAAISCADLGRDCGEVDDGCGGTLACGECADPDSCGGAGVDGVCGCQVPTWTTEVVHPMLRDFVARDGAGGYHAAYLVGKEVFYEARAPGGSEWSGVSIFESANTVRMVALQVVGTTPHIIFAAGTVLTHASPGANGWNMTSVSNAYGAYIAAVVDPSGTTHVCGGSPLLGVGYQRLEPGGQWITESVYDDVNAYTHCAIGFDPFGGVHLAYRVYDAPLGYSYRNPGGNWSRETLPYAGASRFTSITVDERGAPHITADGHYLHRDAASIWQDQEITAMDIAERAIASDPAGGVHVMALATQNKDLLYAHLPAGGGWSAELVDFLGDAGARPAIGVGRDGSIHVVYQDNTDGVWKHARGGWCPSP